MRKKIYIVMALATAVAALLSCARIQEESPAGQVVQFAAGAPGTRTAFTAPEGDTYPVVWTANDSKVKIALNGTQVKDAAVSPAADGKSAAFTASFDAGTAPYTFRLLSPASAFVASSETGWTLRVPASQTPSAQSVDEAAQILVAEAKGFAEMPAKVVFALDHWTAYGLLTFENLSLDGANVSAVELKAEQPLAGEWTWDAGTGTATVKEGVKTLTIQTASVSGVWFACAPADLSGTKLTVKVVTDKGNCTKEVTLPADRKLLPGKVARIKVDMTGIAPKVPGLKVQRLWGKFSTADHSWNEYYGGTPNADRNLAMDDDYIYLPETTKAAKLWRMSLDGKTVTEANVEGVSGGTFAISCVRMVPNTSAKVNGGKDFLMGVSMTEGDNSLPVYVYSYDEGTDKAPKKTSATTGWGRRLGDKFTVYGSLQDGALFFKDNNNVGDVGAFMVLRMAWGVAPVDGYFNPRRTNLYAESGTGAYYPYPGDVLHGIYTSTSSGQFVSMTKSPLDINPNESATLTPAGGYYKDAHGINYFTFNGKKYIAYAKNAGGGDGRVYILEGAESDTWESLFNAKRKVIYQATIQSDIEFFDGNYHAEMEQASPRSSGHSGLDLTVREIDGEVFIAAVKQNVGLSLFKMFIE